METSDKSLRNLWSAIEQADTHVLGIPGGKEAQKRAKSCFEEIMAKKLPESRKERNHTESSSMKCN